MGYHHFSFLIEQLLWCVLIFFLSVAVIFTSVYENWQVSMRIYKCLWEIDTSLWPIRSLCLLPLWSKYRLYHEVETDTEWYNQLITWATWPWQCICSKYSVSYKGSSAHQQLLWPLCCHGLNHICQGLHTMGLLLAFQDHTKELLWVASAIRLA